ncbi:LIC_10190 family membrane protein [Chryseobacterium sp. PET-29]|uniref:LIC_10190 family membrane protein n=1 Tax=Chryseobacterium sp. PET-29 TaxID=2983267 RepID=UPI00398FFB44
MLLMFLSIVILIPTLMGWGKIIHSVLGPCTGGVAGHAFSGILGLSIIFTILSYFTPLNFYVEISAICMGLLFFFRDHLYKKFHAFSKKDCIIIVTASIIIVFCSSFYPFVLDHYGYYVPSIRWLTEYGMVKGISNLDITLGQMSVWHIFQAGFSHFSDPFLRINSIVLIIYILYIIEEKSWIQLCFIPVLLLFSQSPSPDLPVIVFSLIILNEIMKGNTSASSLFVFSSFVFIIKPTMVWLPILGFLYSFCIIKSRFISVLPGFAVILLFFIKNIYTFGYPIFPVAFPNLEVHWQPNPEILKISSRFAIQKTYDMQYSYEEIRNFSFTDYIKNWFLLDGIKSKINILFIVSILIFIVFTIIKKNRTITLICISLIIKSIAVLLFSAQYRFFVDVFFVTFFVLLASFFNRQKSLIVFFALSTIIISFLMIPDILKTYLPSFRPGSFMSKYELKQLYKPSTYHYHNFNSYKIGNLKFNVSKNYPYNFDTPLPAISESYIYSNIKAGIFPQLADEKNVHQGFIWKKLTTEQKAEAEKVIYSIKKTYQQNR